MSYPRKEINAIAEKVYWISKHELSPAQLAQIRTLKGNDVEIIHEEVAFEGSDVVALVSQILGLPDTASGPFHIPVVWAYSDAALPQYVGDSWSLDDRYTFGAEPSYSALRAKADGGQFMCAHVDDAVTKETVWFSLWHDAQALREHWNKHYGVRST